MTMNNQPLMIKVQVVLTENQLNVIKSQAKHEHRSVSNMIQILLHEGWLFYVNNHEINVPHPEYYGDGSSYPKKYCNDQESIDLMIPAIPDYDTSKF